MTPPDSDHASDPAPGEAAPALTPFGARDVDPREKPRLVRGVFDAVAGRYDLMNDLMSGGAHRIWKDIVIARAQPRPGERLLDAAGGTGDLAFAWLRRAEKARARRGGPPAEAIVADINADMLIAGRRRAGADRAQWLQADLEALPLPGRSVDCVTIGFGLRNVTDRTAALSEMRRVLRPGGRFLCLEMSHPTTAALERLYGLYADRAIPAIGRAAVGTADPYRYFVDSVKRFPDQAALTGEIRAAGFASVSHLNFGGGVAALHTGWAI